MIKAIVADNHPIVRYGIHALRRGAEDIRIIGDVSTTNALFEMLKEQTPHVIIMELELPQINGIAALRYIKEEYPEVNVLIYSGQSEDVYA